MNDVRIALAAEAALRVLAEREIFRANSSQTAADAA